MAKAKTNLSLEEEIMVLLFWAHGVDIRRNFSPELLQAIPELEKAVEAISCLPDVIGWGDGHRRSVRASRGNLHKKAVDGF